MNEWITFETCKYCQEMKKLGFPSHEDEILKIGLKHCKGRFWKETLESELRRLNHATISKIEEYRIVNRLHKGCACREATHKT